MKKLDNVWKALSNLERKCLVDFSKLDAIPELDLNGNDCIKIDSKRRSKILQRLRLFKTIKCYTTTIETAECLGFKIIRDKFGKHSITTNKA